MKEARDRLIAAGVEMRRVHAADLAQRRLCARVVTKIEQWIQHADGPLLGLEYMWIHLPESFLNLEREIHELFAQMVQLYV